jgi:hypothetical protein
LLEQAECLFCKLRCGSNTHLYESFHAWKAKLSCKDIAWRASWWARVAAAVLGMNESDWRLQLYEQLGLPKLDPSAVQITQKHECDVAHRARTWSKEEERMKWARVRAIQRRFTQQLERTHLEYQGLGWAPNPDASQRHDASAARRDSEQGIHGNWRQ